MGRPNVRVGERAEPRPSILYVIKRQICLLIGFGRRNWAARWNGGKRFRAGTVISRNVSDRLRNPTLPLIWPPTEASGKLVEPVNNVDFLDASLERPAKCIGCLQLEDPNP